LEAETKYPTDLRHRQFSDILGLHFDSFFCSLQPMLQDQCEGYWPIYPLHNSWRSQPPP
jgi:hypothetical protein